VLATWPGFIGMLILSNSLAQNRTLPEINSIGTGFCSVVMETSVRSRNQTKRGKSKTPVVLLSTLTTVHHMPRCADCLRLGRAPRVLCVLTVMAGAHDTRLPEDTFIRSTSSKSINPDVNVSGPVMNSLAAYRILPQVTMSPVNGVGGALCVIISLIGTKL
jgi:hypothetical protein